MKDRAVTAVGAIVACLVAYSLFFQSTGGGAVPRPLSIEPGQNGYLALNNWLADEGVRVTSWRERFDLLPDSESGLAGSGNVLLTTMPHRHSLRDSEQR